MEITGSHFELLIILFVMMLLVAVKPRLLTPWKILKKRADQQFYQPKNSDAPPPILTGILRTLMAVLAVTGIVSLLRQTPEVILTRPQAAAAIGSYDKPVEFVFNVPVDMRKIGVHNTAVMQGTWEKVNYLPFLPIGRIIRFIPTGTSLPGTTAMFYLSNISKPLSPKPGGEFLLEALTPELPVVISVSPSDGAMDIALDTGIEFILDKPGDPALEWSAQIEPSVLYNLTFKDGRTVRISFPERLQSGTFYQVSLITVPAVYDFATGETSGYGDKTLVSAAGFTTLKAPYILSIQPQGTTVAPDSRITVTFQEPMDESSVVSGFTLSPPSPGVSGWNDDSTVYSYTTSPLNRNTTYTVRLKKGIRTKNGGELGADAEYRFKTIGAAGIADTVPRHQSQNIPADSEIRISFDQEVDRPAAESRFSITPTVRGSISWSGSTMIFKPSVPLPFSSPVTFRISSGVPAALGTPSDREYAFTFSTGPEEFVLPVLNLKQQESFTCNIAAARILLKYRGIDINETDLKGKIGMSGSRGNGNPHKGYTADYGTYWEPIQSVLNQFRPTRVYRDFPLGSLTDEVRRGNPVLVWGQNGWSDPHEISWTSTDGTPIYAINGMHSYVVKGYRGTVSNPTHIITSDPWRGDTVLTTADFLDRWKYLNRTALILD